VKRILYVHNDYARPSGEEYAAEGIVDLLRAHGHEVFWFRRSSAEMSGSFGGRAKAFLTGIHNPFAAKALARKLDEVKPDIVQVQNLYPFFSPSILGPVKKRRIPIVMRCPNYRLFCPNGLHLSNGTVCEKCLCFGRELWCVVKNCEGDFCKSLGYALRNACARITKRITNRVDMFTVQTQFQKQKFAERGIAEDRIAIVPGFVLPPDGIGHTLGDLVTFVGRVSPEKGIDDFIDAARVLPDIRFAVAGNEQRMPGLRQACPSNVQVLGFLEEDELNALYLKSRIVVVPSRCYEGFPNAVVRAMAVGRPVVASRIGALASIVEDKRTGLLFEVGNVRDLAGKLSYLYGNQDLCERLGAAARQSYSLKYSGQRTYDLLMSAYEKAAQHCIGEGVTAIQQGVAQ